ncbi:MAG: peroxiredoxin family protein, partial [Myxococcota bacterium]|nr:peroxiredoxin family protein [Myxococcota bacterium]
MKQTALFTVALAGWLAVVGTVASCGDDDEEDRKTTDTGTGDDTDTENQDTATTDTTEGTDSEVEVPQCKSEGFAPLVETARVSTIFGVEYLGFSSDSMPYDQLVVRMKMVEMRYPEAGTYALEGADLSTCTNCVIAGKSCSNDGCEKLYVGTFGDIVAQSVGPYKKAMKGILSGVIMEEVEQDPNTGVTSVKPGGDVWCLDNFEYDATVLSFADGTCPRPGINCVGETVPDFTMTSCDSGQDVSMAELTQDKKAVLYVLVTGWCYYCTEWMPEVVPYAEALLESGL